MDYSCNLFIYLLIFFFFRKFKIVGYLEACLILEAKHQVTEIQFRRFRFKVTGGVGSEASFFVCHVSR